MPKTVNPGNPSRRNEPRSYTRCPGACAARRPFRKRSGILRTRLPRERVRTGGGATEVGPDTSAGANQTVQLSTPRWVARHAGNAAHGPEHAHELPERLRVGENVRIGIV
jgi:hypothetical protein